MSAGAEKTIAGRYELGERLGLGGMSTVQVAFDTRLERYVAVKLLAEHLADDAQFVTRFRREAWPPRAWCTPTSSRSTTSGSTSRRAGTTSSWSGSWDRRARRCCASADTCRSTRPSTGSPSPAAAGVRPSQRARPPRRQARQPAALRSRRDDQARGLRHRQDVERRVVDHAGRLGPGHRRLPGARAGRGRGGRAGRRPVRAGRRRLPAAEWPPALRGGVADRAGA